MIKTWIKLFSIPKNLVALNSALIIVLIMANSYFQVFCIPTDWAILLLIISFGNTIIYPLLQESKFSPLSDFINGLTFCIFLYCIIFLEHLNVLGLLGIPIGIGFIIFIPHFILIQLLWRMVIKPINKSARIYFSGAVIVCILTSFYIGKQYEEAIIKIERFIQSDYKNLETDFMTEKILGMHFIYHTRFCEYDGWRPPKHEPFLVMGMWLNNRVDPLNVDLMTRINLYKNFFPLNEVKFNCSCAIEYSNDYHNDLIWKK